MSEHVQGAQRLAQRVAAQLGCFPFKGEQGAKDAGKMRAEGKDYFVKDGDVMNFLFSS